MSCPYDRQDLSAYVDGEIDGEAEGLIREHLRTCRSCRREVGWLKTVSRMVHRLPRLEPDTAITWKAERLGQAHRRVPGCAVVLPQASALLDDELPPEDGQQVIAHLASCEACYRAFKEIERVSETIAAIPWAPVPEGLEARIMAAIEAEGRFPVRRMFESARALLAPVPRVVVRLAVAAALVFAIGVGVWFAVRPGAQRPVEFVKVRTAVVGGETNSLQTVSSPPTRALRIQVAEASRHKDLSRRVSPSRLAGTPQSPPSAELAAPPPARGAEPSEHAAPTILRPPGEAGLVISTPVASVPAREMLREPDKAIAGLGPEAVASAAAGPALVAPPAVSSKSSLPQDGERPRQMPLLGVGQVPPPAESDPDVHVHVARAQPRIPAAPPSSGIDSSSLKAAEARLNNSVRVLSRSEPRRFPISP